MITRRKLLAMLGLGGAATAVASKAEALGESRAARCTDADCGVAIEHDATAQAHEMRVLTYEPTTPIGTLENFGAEPGTAWIRIAPRPVGVRWALVGDQRTKSIRRRGRHSAWT